MRQRIKGEGKEGKKEKGEMNEGKGKRGKRKDIFFHIHPVYWDSVG